MYELKQVPSEAQIRKYLRRILFGKNIFCPECRSRQVVVYEKRYRCKKCRLKFTLISHTWLKGMKLSYQKFWIVLWCWTTQVPVKQAMALTELSEEAIRRWYDRFRAHLPLRQGILERIIQLDETFFKRMTLMMAKQQGTRKLAFEMFSKKDVQREDATKFLQSYVRPKAKLRTDGNGIYRGIHGWWPVRHQVDIHRKFEFGYTSEIEGIFANLRTFIRRMYHHVTPEKLPEVVSEFCFRFSSPEIFNNPLTFLKKTLKLVPFD